MKKESIRYFSTNYLLPGGFSERLSFKEALIMGQAPDEGLFMPVQIPKFSFAEIEQMMGMPIPVVANMVLRKFFTREEIGYEKLWEIMKDAYNFLVPLEKVVARRYIMRLDQGPTASFKDFAARAMARLMSHFRKPGQRLHILVVTSGDTGSAVGEAYKGVDGIDVTILYPAAEVSGRQKKQLDTIGDNVQAISVEGGKFDDCQDLAKEAFSDPDLAGLNLTSANSINIGRILPQIVYYFYAYAQLADGEEQIVFSVPSGNFGDVLGCEYARRMGLPVKKIIVATNENDEFPKYLHTGNYVKISPSLACLSNAMNVGHPSNLARLFALYGGTVDRKGKVWCDPFLELMRKEIFAVSVSDEETRQTIKEAYERFGVILEPHGAVGWRGLEVFRERLYDVELFVSLETAHPAKFPEEIEALLGIKPEMLLSMKNLDQRQGEPIVMSANYAELKKYLLNR